MKQINSGSKGQVIVIAVVIMVILMLGILFLFDLQSVIRSKVKLETANQAAALSAAQWQKESLNLIGELNLIKASDQLLASGHGNTPKDIGDDANRMLTQMQARLAFVGPVIAFGAAQQAAKNNGVNLYDYQKQSASGTGSMNNTLKQVHTDAQSYRNSLDPTNSRWNELRYGDACKPGNPVYDRYPTWRDDYVKMLDAVISQGVVVLANVRIGIERVSPYAFKDPMFYKAISGEWWCYIPLRSLLKQPDSYWSGKWWQNIQYDNPNFTGQSEIYNLGVHFDDASPAADDAYFKEVNTPGLWDYYFQKHNMAGATAKDNTIDPGCAITWCTYDGSWDSARMEVKADSEWNRSSAGSYLSGDLKKSVIYDGPLAYAKCSQTINLVNTFESKMSSPTASQAQASLQGAANPSPIRTRNDTIINNGVPVGDDRHAVIARTIGHLGSDPAAKPTDVQIILPAFDNVAIFPYYLFVDNVNTLRNTDDPLSAFIIWLKTADDIYTPTVAPPAGTQLYLQAIQKLDTEFFRRSGYNNKYVTGSVANDAYFSDAYKYSATNPGGAGWLQQAYIFTNSDPKYVYDSSKTTIPDTINPSYSRYYFPGSNLYILIDAGGKVRTNEQQRCGTGYAPGGSSGPNSGPVGI